MNEIDLGPVAFVWRGGWDAATSDYGTNHVVLYQGNQYIAVADDIPAGTPPTDPAWWEEYLYSGSRLPAPSATLYVRADGNDANDGFTEQTAKATLQNAVDTVSLYDFGKNAALIDVGPGTFTGATFQGGPDTPSVSIQGKGESTRITTIPGTNSALRVYQQRNVNYTSILFENRVEAVEAAYVITNGDTFFDLAAGTEGAVYARKAGRFDFDGGSITVRGSGTHQYFCATNQYSSVRIAGDVHFESPSFTTSTGPRTVPTFP